LVVKGVVAAHGAPNHVAFRIPIAGCKVGVGQSSPVYFVSNVEGLWVSFRAPKPSQAHFLAQAMRNTFAARIALSGTSSQELPLKMIFIILAVMAAVIGLLVRISRWSR
jgi:hypothetical protein